MKPRQTLKLSKKASLYIWISYKFLLKSVKILKWIWWATDLASRIQNGKFGWQIQNYFSGKARETFKLPKNFLRIFEFSIIYFEVCQEPKSNLMSHGMLVQGFKTTNVVHEYKTIFLGKRGRHLHFLKTFSL